MIFKNALYFALFPLAIRAEDGGILFETGPVTFPSTACSPFVEEKYVDFDLGSSSILQGVTISLDDIGASDPYCNIFVSVWDEGEPVPPIRTALPSPSPTELATTPPTKTPTEAPVPAPSRPSLNCVVCGDLNAHVPCTDMDLVMANPTTCPEGKPICMNTIVQQDLDVKEYKECVDEPTADSLWYQATSDDLDCINFDPSKAQDQVLICHLACYGEMCNIDTNPPEDTYFIPGRRLDEVTQPTNTYVFSTMEYDASSGPLNIPLDPPRPVRHVRLWVDRKISNVVVTNIVPKPAVESSEIIDEGVQTASVGGDPHFKTWSGDKFDFHGECDLVLLQHRDFLHGLGLYIHIRTKISTWWSSIEAAAIQIGEGTLEVVGGKDGGKYWVNGQESEELDQDDHFFSLAGFTVKRHRVSHHQVRYRIDLQNEDALSIETFKDFVSVNVKAKNHNKFHGSAGLMGDYPIGNRVARDGKTVIQDPNVFGQEWQVTASEPVLFRTAEGNIQYPQECAMPSMSGAASRKQLRRLGELTITEEDAAIACSHAGEDHRDACVFDVLATNDKEMAGAY